MADKLAIVGASGKLGFATLSALLEHNLLPAPQIVCTTSSSSGAQKLESARGKGVEVRSAAWDDDQETWIKAFQDCSKLFLISSSRIDKDFNEAPPGKGRESDHYPVIDAARQAGIKHIYYTSLAFANPSLSRVMTAHERTEEYLKKTGLQYTIIREGLYNESWPLYFGHYDVPNDARSEIVVAGDSKISWTSIPDLGLANAIVLSESGDKYVGKTFYLAQHATKTLNHIAGLVSKAKGKEIKLKVVSRDEHEKHHVQEQGKPEPFIKWWSRTYDALRQNECEINDSTLEKLLSIKGIKPKAMEETVREMLA